MRNVEDPNSRSYCHVFWNDSFKPYGHLEPSEGRYVAPSAMEFVEMRLLSGLSQGDTSNRSYFFSSSATGLTSTFLGMKDSFLPHLGHLPSHD